MLYLLGQIIYAAGGGCSVGESANKGERMRVWEKDCECGGESVSVGERV